jgi:hypothetical protein
MPHDTTPTTGDDSPSRKIDARIAELGDWRGTTLARIRALITRALPDVVEDWKWRGVPVWYHNGQICTGETYKAVVKLTFLKGASLSDPHRLFNSSLDGNARRAIDLHDGEQIDAAAFTALVRAAAALNAPPEGRATATTKTGTKTAGVPTSVAKKAAVKKAAVKKTAAKKTAAEKTAVKKTAVKRTPLRTRVPRKRDSSQ